MFFSLRFRWPNFSPKISLAEFISLLKANKSFAQRKENLIPTITKVIHAFSPLCFGTVQKVHSPNLSRDLCISKLFKTGFFILCDVILLVRLRGKFEIDHSWEWKGEKESLLFYGITNLSVTRDVSYCCHNFGALAVEG